MSATGELLNLTGKRSDTNQKHARSVEGLVIVTHIAKNMINAMYKLTTHALDLLPKGAIIASGKCPDTPEGLNLTNGGHMLKWVAVRGTVGDWAVYAHNEFYTEDWIAKRGMKIHDLDTVAKLIDCSELVLSRYRN